MATSKANASIVALDRFIRATRDSGYKGTVSAICEIVDNALQAEASSVEIHIAKAGDDPDFPIVVDVVDDGVGMDRATLRQALRFGGSTRFEDRRGLGRFGMGLPNASLSQARQVEVFTWQSPDAIDYSYLDVDEIAEGRLTAVPSPRRKKLPWREPPKAATGTVVRWTRCDRLDNRRPTTLARKVNGALGRVFRYFIWAGVQLEVNGETVVAVDPLFVREPSSVVGGSVFGDPMVYEIRAPSSNGKPVTGEVSVSFTELPIHKWHGLSNEEKRRIGITNSAGVSVVRSGREIDYGWLFLQGKRRENYDDWWRAEVCFEPVLDEYFGITHTKQQIKPTEQLLELLGEDMANQARILNSRARRAHTHVRAAGLASEAESTAGRRDGRLRPMKSSRVTNDDRSVMAGLKHRHSDLNGGTDGHCDYRIVEDELADSSFMRPVLDKGLITVVINPQHPFYRRVYGPLSEGASDHPEMLEKIQLLLLSAARAELAGSASDRKAAARFRGEWSQVLNAFLKSS